MQRSGKRSSPARTHRRGTGRPGPCKAGARSTTMTLALESIPSLEEFFLNTTIRNKRALHDYAVEERFETGLVLRGWEVKSVRAGRATINLSHVYIRDGELYLCNASFTPTDQTCTHEHPEALRTRKVLMHRKEIERLIGKVERAGYALIPLDLHFSKGRVKMQLALARGKREFEKRSDESKKEWKRQQERLMKNDMTRGKPRQNYKDV